MVDVMLALNVLLKTSAGEDIWYRVDGSQNPSVLNPANNG
jgi:hypothetical protein